MSSRRDGGQATAELALGLPTLGAIVILALWLLAAVGSQARVAEAARIGARAAARGDADGQVAAWVRGAAPAGATVEITRRDDQVAVTVHYRLAAAGPLVTPIALTATATAPTETAITDAARAAVVDPADLDLAPSTTTPPTQGDAQPSPTTLRADPGAGVGGTRPTSTSEPTDGRGPTPRQSPDGVSPPPSSRPPPTTPEPASVPSAAGEADGPTPNTPTTGAAR